MCLMLMRSNNFQTTDRLDLLRSDCPQNKTSEREAKTPVLPKLVSVTALNLAVSALCMEVNKKARQVAQ